jgi:hypothetical protein
MKMYPDLRDSVPLRGTQLHLRNNFLPQYSSSHPLVPDISTLRATQLGLVRTHKPTVNLSASLLLYWQHVGLGGRLNHTKTSPSPFRAACASSGFVSGPPVYNNCIISTIFRATRVTMVLTHARNSSGEAESAHTPSHRLPAIVLDEGSSKDGAKHCCGRHGTIE